MFHQKILLFRFNSIHVVYLIFFKNLSFLSNGDWPITGFCTQLFAWTLLNWLFANLAKSSLPRQSFSDRSVLRLDIFWNRDEAFYSWLNIYQTVSGIVLTKHFEFYSLINRSLFITIIFNGLRRKGFCILTIFLF